MNYFKAISHRSNELDKLGQAYLDKFTFMSNDDILDRLWQIANALFDGIKRDWNRADEIPEWATSFLDGHVPYGISNRGSLYRTLGLSVVSNDAHLRNLLERAEGREGQRLGFPVLAEKDIVLKLSK